MTYNNYYGGVMGDGLYGTRRSGGKDERYSPVNLHETEKKPVNKNFDLKADDIILIALIFLLLQSEQMNIELIVILGFLLFAGF